LTPGNGRSPAGASLLLAILVISVGSALGSFVAFATTLPVPVATPSTAEISIEDFAFTPAAISVEPGTTVKWLNRDEVPHTVVATSLAFRSNALDADESYEHQINEVGVINYFCSLHPHMTGKIIVRATRNAQAGRPLRQVR